MNKPHTISDDLPSGLIRPCPITNFQVGLFRVTLPETLAKQGVSPDELRRWHDNGWLSFNDELTCELDEFGDPRIFEIQIVRDIVRSGLGDAQIEALLFNLPKPFAFDPDRLAFSFRHGWVQVTPPAETPAPDEVIEEYIDDWIAGCDKMTLEELRDKIREALEACAEDDQES